jgi:hypothetical protein
MFAGSGAAIIIGAAATATAGGFGSDTVTIITGTTIIITGTTITTAGIVTDPESCCVPDSGATAVLRRVFLSGRPADLC